MIIIENLEAENAQLGNTIERLNKLVRAQQNVYLNVLRDNKLLRVSRAKLVEEIVSYEENTIEIHANRAELITDLERADNLVNACITDGKIRLDKVKSERDKIAYDLKCASAEVGRLGRENEALSIACHASNKSAWDRIREADTAKAEIATLNKIIVDLKQ